MLLLIDENVVTSALNVVRGLTRCLSNRGRLSPPGECGAQAPHPLAPLHGMSGRPGAYRSAGNQLYDEPPWNFTISRLLPLRSAAARRYHARMPSGPQVLPRCLAPRLRESLGDTPAVLIHGPRQSGKTTLARIVSEPRGYRYSTGHQNSNISPRTRSVWVRAVGLTVPSRLCRRSRSTVRS